MQIPATLLAHADRGEDWATWLDGLPQLVTDLLTDWALTPDGPPAHGETSLVLPVRMPDRRPGMLKVTWPHEEAEHEHLALQRWHGDGAVGLVRADPRRWALLLERLHSRDLTAVPVARACRTIAALYARLHVPASPQFRPLSGFIARWTDGLAGLGRDAPLPHRLVAQAVSLGRRFAGDEATDGTLVHTDLHYENVLAADRQRWLAIDPKPVSGDPHYEVAPLLWNRWEEVVASGDVRGAVRDRLAVVVDAAGLDPDRARDWVVVRQMHNALWCLTDVAARPGGLTEKDREELTRCVTIAKAVQG